MYAVVSGPAGICRPARCHFESWGLGRGRHLCRSSSTARHFQPAHAPRASCILALSALFVGGGVSCPSERFEPRFKHCGDVKKILQYINRDRWLRTCREVSCYDRSRWRAFVSIPSSPPWGVKQAAVVGGFYHQLTWGLDLIVRLYYTARPLCCQSCPIV